MRWWPCPHYKMVSTGNSVADSPPHLPQNKRDFGSFQSSNVQELIELSDVNIMIIQ